VSLTTRQELVAAVQCANPSDISDLLNPQKTNTYLIALLSDLKGRCGHPLLITAVNTDHHPDGNGHGHSKGWAADLWNGDYGKVGDDKVFDIIKALVVNPYCWTIGLAGKAQQYAEASHSLVTDKRQIIFLDEGLDHVHVQAGNMYGEGIR
jgi:hypothetical protein